MEDSVDDNKLDLIWNNPKKALLILAIPLMLSMMVDLINDVVNSIWLSALGSKALAAFGFLNPLLIITVGIGIGLGAGSSAVMAKFIGEDKKDQATNAALHSIILAILLFILIPLICIIFMEPIFLALGAKDVLQLTCDYGFYFLVGMFAFAMPLVLQPILIIGGDTKRASYPLILSAIANVFLNPVFIFHFNLGISGSAIATIVSQTVFAILPMVYWIFIKKDTLLDISFNNFRFDKNILKNLLLVGIPAAMEEGFLAILSASINFILSIVAGTTAVAVYSTSWRLVELGLTPIFGLGMALVTVIGVHYGAKNWDKFKLSFNYAAKMSILLGVIVTILLFIFSDPLSSIFAIAEESTGLDLLIAKGLRILVFYLITSSVGYIVTYYLQGVEKGVTLFILTGIKEVICCIITISIFVFVLGWGEFGVYAGMITGGLLGSIILYIFAKYDIRKIIKNSV